MQTRQFIEVIEKVKSGDTARRHIRTVAATLRAVHAQGSVTLIFTGDREQQILNTRYRRRRRTTDVLSFPGTDGKRFVAVGEPQHIGDVVISVPEARREARRKGITLAAETMMLVVHGVLHCLGFDHERPADSKKMLPLQRKILRQLMR